MKRAPIVLIGTVAGVAGVLALNPSGDSALNAGSNLDSSQTSTQGGSTSSGTTSSDSGASTTTSGSSSSSSSSSSASGTSTKTTGKSGTATGAAYSAARYGYVQVKVTVKNGKITKIATVKMPSNDGRSQWISQQAGPMLTKQALAAQSANINGVSGATFTSNAYAQSLQSALDKLGV